MSGDSKAKLAERVGAVYGPGEVAALLGVSTRSLERYIAAGTFPPPDLRLSKRCLRWTARTVEGAIHKRKSK